MGAVSSDPGTGVAALSDTRHRGVVLVAVLGLLALLLLLVTTLSLVSRVDTTVGLAQDRHAEARRHALVALEQARAHLQVAAGPDQRVTATSGWQGGALPVAHSLTGVWSTEEASPRLLTWLVSGNAVDAAPEVTPQSVPAPEGVADPDEVILVDRASVARDQDRVKLRRQPLRIPERLFPGGERAEAGAVRTVGHTAYWIGDEGVKASLALAAGTALPDYDNRSTSGSLPGGFVPGERWSSDIHDRMRLAQSVPRGPRFEALFPGFDPLADEVGDRLARVLTREQLAFVRPELTPARLRAVFGAVTPVSRAVLADSVRGGLRRDLSDLPAVESPVLRRFLSERPVAFDGSRPVHRLQSVLEDPPGAGGEPDLVFSVGPVVTEYLVRFRVVRDPETGRVGLGYEQQVELWNPYTAILEAEPGDLVVHVRHLPRLSLATPSGGAEVDLNAVVAAGSTAAIERWLPGEVRVLRGAAWLGTDPAESRWYPPETLTVPAGVEPLQVELRVEPVPGTHPVAVETRVRGRPLATVRPAAEVAAGQWMVNLNESGGPWRVGYGVQLRDEPGAWADGTRVEARDPRWPRLEGDCGERHRPRRSSDPGAHLDDLSSGSTQNFDPSRRWVFFELPSQEVVSLGSLQHVITRRPQSWGNPWGATLNVWFDRGFLSTIPRGYEWQPAEPRPLPNPALQVYWRDGTRVPDSGDRGSDTGGMLDAPTVGLHGLQRGAFSINSLEESAWRAVLGGVDLAGWRHGERYESTSDLRHAYLRFSHTAQGSPGNPRGAGPGPFADWGGVRCLEDSEIEAVARSIVRQLKARAGPYGSISAFLNDGVLARAVEEAGLSAALPPSARSLPGWVTQADVVTALGPVLASRSDTFVVRAYGDAVNPVTGETQARAWCEAVLQRVPELEQGNTRVTASDAEQAQADTARFPLGRSVIVASFRWLTEADL